jgi:hypothetical protein
MPTPTVYRRALVDTLMSVTLPLRFEARWEFPADAWKALKLDWELKSNWTDEPIGRTLFGLPVTVVETGLAAPRLILPVCGQ